ncbi:hypothetical protein NE237_025761 [Protea cynaroides]|uniref:Acyl-[acyl-carrier-protein] hydrolase n=1 Tax=Protea cynaroides TaxID=273540 RepID=A0A9Q0H3M5_9MAGN|nr:hypothetical protein NE237_025761 [Protea cynaroides]
MASIGMTMMLGRDPFSLGTLKIKSKSLLSPPPGGVSLAQANLRAQFMKGSQSTLKHLDRIEWEHDMIADTFVLGTKVEKDSRIFSQNYTIRSYDMGPNHTATIETLMNLLQETALNHFKSMGLLKDGLGSTPEMSARNLIWVLSKIQVVVDRYPTCMFMMMNKETRKLSDWPEGVKKEIEPHYIKRPALLDKDCKRLRKLDHNKMEYVRNGLIPRWDDLDINQHVNNAKYVGMMLESIPFSFMENRELYSITMEFRRECAMDDVLQSLTSFCNETIDQCFHLLRTECGAMVARGRTKWMPRHVRN